MISEKDYDKVLDAGLCLDHYFLLCNIKNKSKLSKNSRIQGFINLLKKKGFVSEDDLLTDAGVQMVENCTFTETVAISSKELNLNSWAEKVHTSCENKMLFLTGSIQVKSKLAGRNYPFLANKTDLTKNLVKVVSLYKLKDLDKIERVVLRHIENCHKSGGWFPLMYYYIFKEGKSQLVTDLETIDSVDKEDGQFDVIDSKEQF